MAIESRIISSWQKRLGLLLLFVGVLLSARTLAAVGDASDPGAPRTESKGRKRDP